VRNRLWRRADKMLSDNVGRVHRATEYKKYKQSRHMVQRSRSVVVMVVVVVTTAAGGDW